MLESLKNLANNGRVGKIAATAAGVLGIRAVGRASDQGTLEMLSKCRGAAKAIEALIDYMKKYGFCEGKARIAHCLSESTAKTLAQRIKAEFPRAKVAIAECRALCSFYAERGGLLLGFEV
jgi:fatty acid-binding protein DegV